MRQYIHQSLDLLVQSIARLARLQAPKSRATALVCRLTSARVRGMPCNRSRCLIADAFCAVVVGNEGMTGWRLVLTVAVSTGFTGVSLDGRSVSEPSGCDGAGAS